MASSVNTRMIAERAKAIYLDRLRETLENEHPHSFVAIEPDSGAFFIGKSLGDAIDKAQLAYPDRVTHTIRVGHDAALEIGRLA
ncbi:MAG: hypothetical protein WCH39_23410 [Schlesneria sp.]